MLTNEISALYNAYAARQANPLPPLVIQFSDYAHWEGRQIAQGESDHQQVYWQDQLKGLPLVHNLPLDHSRPPEQSFVGRAHNSLIDKSLTDALTQLCATQGSTLFVGLHALFALLLGRYSGENDIVIGTSTANREHPNVAPLIGFFLNTLVLRSDLSTASTFTELLAQSKAVVLGAFGHQQLPFEALIKSLAQDHHAGHNLSYSPIFQVMLLLQNTDKGHAELSGLTLDNIYMGRKISKFDLSLYINEAADGLHITWEYALDLFQPSTIARIATSLNQLLRAIVADSNALLAQLPLASIDEQPAVESLVYPQEQWVETTPQYESLEYALRYVFNEAEDLPATQSMMAQLSHGFRQMDYPQQLDEVAELLMATVKHGFANKMDLVMGLKFFVNLTKADRPLTPTTIAGRTLLLKASENQQPEQLLEDWRRSILSPSRVVEIQGQHTAMMAGQCLADILLVLRSDLLEG